jgi:hypothetical protein
MVVAEHLLCACVMQLRQAGWQRGWHASCRVCHVHCLSRHAQLPPTPTGEPQRRTISAAPQAAATETSRRRARADDDEKRQDSRAESSVIGEAARRLGELRHFSCACPLL